MEGQNEPAWKTAVAQVSPLQRSNNILLEENDRLRRENAELKRDRIRIDWLEYVGQRVICPWKTQLDVQGFQLKNVTTGFITPYFATYREAIDAGMEEDRLILESVKGYDWAETSHI